MADAVNIEEATQREREELLKRAEEATVGPMVRTLAEILEDPDALKPPEAIVPRMAWASRVSLFVAREKGGKSTTARAAAAVASRGGWHLGGKIHPGPVLLFALEEYVGDVARSLTEFNADPAKVYIADQMTAAPLADFRELVEQLRPRLVVIDTLAAFVDLLPESPESGSAGSWTPIMQALARPCRETGAALLLLHHARKSDGEYRDSTAIGAGVDMILTMTEGKDADTRKVKPKGRWHLEEYTFQLTGGKLVITDGELAIEARVLTFIVNNPGCSTRKLRDGIGARSSDVDDALRLLLKQGSVHDHGGDRGRKLYAPPGCPDPCPDTVSGTFPQWPENDGERVP